MNVLIVDCYDSFTFNLYQQVGRLGGNPFVFTSDTPLEVRAGACQGRADQHRGSVRDDLQPAMRWLAHG